MEYSNFIDPQSLVHLVQLVVAILLGAIIGSERTIAHKSAGMRTFGLISLGSALFVIISRVAILEYAALNSINPLQIASQVVLGIGFIGGGLMMVTGNNVKGITTAAGLWVTAGIGMAVGFELYSLAIFVTILTLLTFTLLWKIEERVRVDFESNESVVGEVDKSINIED